MVPQDPILLKILHKLQSRVELSTADCRAVLALPYVQRSHEPPAYVLREGEPIKARSSFVLSGFAFRQRVTAAGVRQIVSIHMAGDFLDLQHLFLNQADHSVQALTRLETAVISQNALQQLFIECPSVAKAMFIDALIEASIFREWVVNVGRRDARARIAHLLCEFAARLDAAGLAETHGYILPITQEQLGDAVGLTSVHVNRTLGALAAEGILERNKRQIRFDQWVRLREACDFNPLYLHLDQAPGTASTQAN
jgi:CRP-like cAMP-binding protein